MVNDRWAFFEVVVKCFFGLFSWFFYQSLALCRLLLNTYICAMQIEVMKSKLHCVSVTQAELDYIGSVTIDEDLMDAANLIENEKVHILNKNNGERFITYVIKGDRGSGVICLNGPAAKKVSLGDVVIIISYATMDFEAAKTFVPWVIFPDTKTNRLK